MGGSDGGPPPHTTHPHPLLPLLALPFFILPALAAATLPQWWPPLARLWRRRSRRLPCHPPALGLAAVYPLSWIYRNGDEFRSGLDAIRLDARQGPSLVPLSALLGPIADDCPPRWVVYCVESPVDAVVLLEIAAGADLLAEPFLDRGVRRVAGARVAVVGTATLGAWAEATYGGAGNGDGGGDGGGGGGINPMAKGLTWVWNTGRCGSTLLHRVLLAAGVCSLSEPYWLEQLARLRAAGALGDEEIRRLLRLCLLADARLIAGAWMPQARVTSVNLKGIGHILLDLAHGLEGRDGRALFLGGGAAVKHLFMYRDMPPVVESLASVFHGHAPPSVRCLLYLWPRWTLNLHWPPWSKRLRRWLGLTAAHDNGDEDAKSAAEFQALAGSAALAMGEWGAARALAVSWLDALATWLEVTDAWPAAEGKATLRMEEFIPPLRRPERLAAVLRFLLGEQAAQGIMKDEATAARCLAVFGVHSQAGSRMQRSSAITGRRFLGPKVNARLRALLASAPDRRIASLRIPNALPVPSIEEPEEGN